MQGVLGAFRELDSAVHAIEDLKKQRFGDITLLLKNVDPKKNRYTVQVMADDKLAEKKDKSINEPVQFYTTKAKGTGRVVTYAMRLHPRPARYPNASRPTAMSSGAI